MVMANGWHDLWLTHWVSNGKAMANVWLSQTQTQTQTQPTYLSAQTYLYLWLVVVVKIIFLPAYVTREWQRRVG